MGIIIITVAIIMVAVHIMDIMASGLMVLLAITTDQIQMPNGINVPVVSNRVLEIV